MVYGAYQLVLYLLFVLVGVEHVLAQGEYPIEPDRRLILDVRVVSLLEAVEMQHQHLRFIVETNVSAGCTGLTACLALHTLNVLLPKVTLE